MIIDFTMTATCRPEIVKRTLYSFSRNLKNVDFSKSSLFINVDPSPVGCNRKKVLKVCKDFFGTVNSRTPGRSNFAIAQKWCFESSVSDFVFNLQDDWKLLCKIDMTEMVKYLHKENSENGNIVQARIPFSTNMNRSKIFLSPSLMIGDFCRDFAKRMKIDINPEVQIKKCGRGRSCLYPNKKRNMLQDIGRDWLRKNRMFRAMSGEGRSKFVKWSMR